MTVASHESKSQLAKLLATENITVQHRANAKTAMFNVKDRVLTLPIWKEMSNDLYDMLVIHEVGHALDTPCDGWLSAITRIAKSVMGDESTSNLRKVKDYMNVIEDARIDKRQKRRFPGSRRNYVKGYKELFENDFFGTVSRDINTMSFIDRINVYFKGGAMTGVRFSKEEDAFIKKIDLAETFDEVLELTEAVLRFVKENSKSDASTIDLDDLDFGDFEMSDEDDDGEGESIEIEIDDSSDEKSEDEGEGKSKAKSEEKSEDEAKETDGKGEGEGEETDTEGDANKGEDSDENEGSESHDESEGFVPDAETERNWQARQDELLANSAVEMHYMKIPSITVDKVVDDFKKVLPSWRSWAVNNKNYFDTAARELTRWKSAENSSISFMVKEFETRKAADAYSKQMISKTGVINTNKLHSYQFSEDIFKRNTIVPTGKNHGFVMFLDWSGSMMGDLMYTMRQLFSMVLFCKRIQVPFDVYTFRDSVGTLEYNMNPGGVFSTNRGDIAMSSQFRLRNVLSSRMSLAELNFAMICLWSMGKGTYVGNESLNGTPLNQAIVAATEIVKRFQKSTRVQVVNTIFLTDGGSNPIGGANGMDRYGGAGRHSRYILQDDVTKRDYNIGAGSWNGEMVTNALLRSLKERTGCNLIGFYLMASSFKSLQYTVCYGASEKVVSEFSKMWNEDGFAPVLSAGYDEYYYLNTRKMRDTQNTLEVNSDMTKAKAAANFMKFSAKKATMRVLLRRFIEKIAA